jgi:hypothetical protein
MVLGEGGGRGGETGGTQKGGERKGRKGRDIVVKVAPRYREENRREGGNKRKCKVDFWKSAAALFLLKYFKISKKPATNKPSSSQSLIS